jgi:hypothetical protein
LKDESAGFCENKPLKKTLPADGCTIPVHGLPLLNDSGEERQGRAPVIITSQNRSKPLVWPDTQTSIANASATPHKFLSVDGSGHHL